ncbi:MAG: DUF58 domain-containing protein [Elainella sp.]
MIPTRRFYLLLLLGAPLAVGLALVYPLNWGLGALLAWDLGLLLLGAWDGWRVRPHRVQIERDPIARLSIGRDNPIHLTLKTGNRPAVLQIRDFYPQTAGLTATPALLSGSFPAQQQDTLSYKVCPQRRGDYSWGPIQLRQLGDWGLVWHNWRVPQAQTVTVYPDLIGLRALAIRLALQNTGSLKRARRLGTGTEFAELREYSRGDDPRLIDWKASSRRSRLLLRVMEPEREQTLIVLLDGGRLMSAQVQGLARFDWGLNAALSLAVAGLNRGDRVGVGVFDRLLHTWMPPERGQAQLSKLVERLSPIQPTLQEPDYLGAVTSLTQQQTRRALVVLLTDLIDKTASAELLSAMAQLTPRYLPFCVALRDPLIDQQAETVSTSVIEGYSRAVALDLLRQRQVALETLKQKGVMILDAPANQISELLVDRYLQLKARSQL